MDAMLCFGHRGAAGHEPENTLLSIEKGIELGADWIHIDVRSVGLECAVIRNERLEETTNGHGSVCEQTWEYVRSLDAGKGQKVPGLNEVIDLVHERAGINIEIKGPDMVSPVVSAIHRAVFDWGWIYRNFLVSSANPLELQLVKCYDPHINIGIVDTGSSQDGPRFAEKLGAYSLHVEKSFVTPEQVEDAHGRGLKVFVYLVNAEEDAARMYAMGVDGVFSDFPEKIIRWRSTRRAQRHAMS